MKSKLRRRRRGSFRVNARGWIHLALTLSVAVAAWFKANNLLFAIFCVLLGIFVATALLTWLVARGMEITRFPIGAVHADEGVAAGFRIRNGKRLWPAFCLRIQDRLTYDGRPAPLQPGPVWLPFAAPGRRVRASAAFSPRERGWAKLGPYRITSEFPPGFFTYSTSIPATDTILVYPRIGVLNRRVLNPYLSRVDSLQPVMNVAAAGDEEFAGLRDYRPGDGLRRIHWKMSARIEGRLLVREFEDARIRDAVLLLETWLPNPNDVRRRARLERAVSFSAALAQTLVAQGYRVRFRAFAPDLVESRLEPGGASLADLLRLLAELKPCRSRPIGELLALEDATRDEIYLVLRIGDEPMPSWELALRSIVIEAADMKRMMFEPEPGLP